MFNDGFCDICSTFQGHEDLKTLFGIMFCSDCRERFTNRTRAELTDEFRKICGYEPKPPAAGDGDPQREGEES